MEGAGRLQRLKEGYQKRLVDNIRYLNDSYALMLKSAQVSSEREHDWNAHERERELALRSRSCNWYRCACIV